MDFIRFFEDKYACSGICESALFFYTQEMQAGPPSRTCLTNMKNVIKENLTFMGIATTLAGLVMVFTLLCQYTLWKSYDDGEEVSKK